MTAGASEGVFALIGASIGAFTSVGVWWGTTRFERARLVHDTRSRVNAQGVSVFRDFLAAAKRVERAAELREAGTPLSLEAIADLTDQMWLRWQEVAVLCPKAVSKPADTFCQVLHRAALDPPSVSIEEELGPPRDALFSVAGPSFREVRALGGDE